MHALKRMILSFWLTHSIPFHLDSRGTPSSNTRYVVIGYDCPDDSFNGSLKTETEYNITFLRGFYEALRYIFLTC